MRWIVCSVVTMALVVGAPAKAGDIEFRPIDTKKLVIQPSKTAANLAAGTINLVGQQAAGSLENNGYIKTINNLFSFKRIEAKFQSGPSALPAPTMYKSTQYKSYNTPVMPISQPVIRR